MPRVVPRRGSVVHGRQDLVTVVGSTTSVSAGERLEATGKWVVDREHGRQFKADELKTTRRPVTVGWQQAWHHEQG